LLFFLPGQSEFRLSIEARTRKPITSPLEFSDALILHRPKAASPWSMKLYFLRHGKADWPNWDRPDDERPLTDEGKKEVAAVAKLLRRLEISPVILSSPLPRASQTAEIAGKHLDARVQEETLLRPGFDASRLKKLLKNFSGKSLMVVGHEPDFTRTISQLTGGNTKLPKAGVAFVEFEPDVMQGQLRWLVPPKFARG
jgi:phosphohistidine phosphatase